jgi:glucose 1-dehydrogenase
MDTDTLMRNIVLKNQLVFGTVNAGAKDFEAAIRDIGIFRQNWPDAMNALITEHISPEEAPSLLQGASRGIKNVITFD